SASTEKDVGCTGRSFTGGRAGSFFDLIAPKSCLTSVRVDFGSMSPAMTRMALLGAYQLSWKLFSALAVVFSNDGRVPNASCAYGVPANMATRIFSYRM